MNLWGLAVFLVVAGIALAVVGYGWGVTLVVLGVLLAFVVALVGGRPRA